MNYRIVLLLVLIALVLRGVYALAQRPKAGTGTGGQLPDFTLKDQDGHDFHAADYMGKHRLVIFFYPKDESPVCTKEACAFRDSYKAFTDAGALVIGINSGSVASHKAFATNHQLPYILLSDPDNKVLKAFGVKNALFLTGRETFIIGRSGRIVYRYRGMLEGSGHARKALEALRQAD